MKKGLIFLTLLFLVLSANATQMMVLGEVFTATW
jgi:hypothetical protein